MRQYKPEQYKRLVENIKLDFFRDYMLAERNFILSTPDLRNKVVVDLGAGYGRILPFLAGKAKRYIGIEINPSMGEALQEACGARSTAKGIVGDMKDIVQLLSTEVAPKDEVLLLLLQNTLGSLEGDTGTILFGIAEFMKQRKSELIVSVLKREALSTNGLKFYESIREMAGDYNQTLSDLDQGVYVTNTGYSSKWWSEQELRGIVEESLGLTVLDHASNKDYRILRCRPQVG